MADQQPPTPDAHAPPQSWQFSLKHALWFTAWFAGVCATAASLGPVVAVFYVVLSVVIASLLLRRTRRLWPYAALLVLLSLGLLAILLPAGRGAREVPMRETCPNHLRVIALGLQNYYGGYLGSYPPAYLADKNGKPMHSWRVLILPYIGQEALYRKYRFDEPWDGPNNRRLAAEMPRCYACPSDPRNSQNSTCTSYLAVVGPEAAWTGKKPMTLGDIDDGTQNTLLVVEVVNSGIHWMEPRDLPVDAMSKQINPRTWGADRGISSKHRGGAWVAMADGSVRFLDDATTRAALDAMLTRAGGEAVE